jgi:hypothetical protein
MVDAAAKAAGYTTKVFHGTISQFNKPNTPLFLGDEGTAMSYAQDRAMGYGEGANPVTYKIYAKFKNTASESDVKQAATDLGLEVENDMAYTALDPKISGSKYVSRVISELKRRPLFQRLRVVIFRSPTLRSVHLVCKQALVLILPLVHN